MFKLLKKLSLDSAGALTLLFWLRLLSLGLLLAASYISQLFPESFFGSLINWPLLSLTVIAAAVLSVLDLSLQSKLNNHTLLFCTLILDSLLWFMAISATGGAVNPAVSYVLILLCVAALSLPQLLSVLVMLVMSVAYAALLEYSPHHHHAMMMSWHLWGMWILFLLNALIMLLVTQFLLRKIRKRDQALKIFREQQVRDEKVMALGTLSASIMHELATPLSTMAVVVEDKKDDSSIMIAEQIKRCRDVLETLREQPVPSEMLSQELAGLLKQEMLLLQPHAKIIWHVKQSFSLEYSSLLEHALLAVLNNAVEAAQERVMFTLDRKGSDVLIEIEHDGSAIDEQTLERLGKETIRSDKGMGIGHYLANASIESLGGNLLLKNDDQAVCMYINLPL